MKEEWREISVTFKNKGKSYSLDYEVSNLGRVYAPDRELLSRWGTTYKREGMILKQFKQNRGYIKTSAGLVHQLVAKAFIPNPDGLREINHKDGDKSNNHVDNLEWINHIENLKHYFKSDKAILDGINRPIRVWNTEGKWLGDFGSHAIASKFLGVKSSAVHNYIKDVERRRFIGKDCYIIREISYNEYKDEKKKEDFPTSRLPKDKRRER